MHKSFSLLLLLGLLIGCSDLNSQSEAIDVTNNANTELMNEDTTQDFSDAWVCDELQYKNENNEVFKTNSAGQWLAKYINDRIETFAKESPDVPKENFDAYIDALYSDFSFNAYNEMFFELSEKYLLVENQDIKEVLKWVNFVEINNLNSNDIYSKLYRKADAIYNYCNEMESGQTY